MKLGIVFNPEFGKVYEKLITQEVPISAGIKLREANVVISAKQKAYEEARMALVKSLADKDENGEVIMEGEGKLQSYKLSEENKTKLIEELNKALEEEFEVEAVQAKDLGDKAYLTTVDLMTLGDLIK